MSVDKYVLIILPGDIIPSTEIRLINIFREMSDVNYSIVKLSKGISADLKGKIIKADVVIFQRNLDVYSKYIFEMCIKAGKIIIFDIDDYLLSIPKASNAAMAKDMKKRLLFLLQNSSYITTSTEKLKGKLLSLNENIEVINNTIKIDNWPIKEKNDHKDEVRVLISNSDYFKLIKFRKHFLQVIRHVLNKRRIKLFLVGATPSRSLIKHPKVYYFEKFQRYNEYLRKIASLNLDFALVPLEDTEFHAAKSIIKYIDYSALGIPGIYSNVEPYKNKNNEMRHMENCLLVENNISSWEDAIDRMIEDESLRGIIRRSAYASVKKFHNIHFAVNKWKDLLDNLIRQKKSSADANKEIDDLYMQFKRVYQTRSLFLVQLAKRLSKYRHVRMMLLPIYLIFLKMRSRARALAARSDGSHGISH